jgi:F420-non-reducing hydrogenase small subunit
MAKKPKIALYWCSSCGGCEESVIDLSEDILVLADRIEIVFWPVALDYKYKHVRQLKDKELAATLINGAVRMGEQAEMAGLLRQKSKIMIAHGSCAHLGGVVGLANFFSRKDILHRSYCEVPTVHNPEKSLPQTKSLVSGREITLSGFHKTVKALDQVVDVDYYIPGCPPTPELIKNALFNLLAGKLPPKGSVLAEKKALCDTCLRKDSIPDKLTIKRFERVFAKTWDVNQCFLQQALICLGPVTRGGCKGRCINANMPCRGCFGPVDRVKDQGAKALSFLTGLIDAAKDDQIQAIADSIPDPAGLFYRYSLAKSILKGRPTG